MSNLFQKGCKRLGAMLLSALMLLAQLAAPVAALATEMETLPSVTLYYQLEEGGESIPLYVEPALDANQLPVYWAMLPPEALAFPVTVTVSSPSDVGAYTYSPASDAVLDTSQLAVDFTSFATQIMVFDQDGVMLESYPLYLSTVEMPLPEPPVVEPVQGRIYIYYIDDTGATVLDASADYDPGTYTIRPDRLGEVGDYYLTDGSDVDVTVYDDGTAYPETVEFYVKKNEPVVEPEPEPEPVTVRIGVFYVDANNDLLLDDSRTVEPGVYTIEPNRAGEIDGYTLYTTDPVEVEVYEDGTSSRNTVQFTMAKNEEPSEPEPEPEQPKPEQPKPEQPDPEQPDIDEQEPDEPEQQQPEKQEPEEQEPEPPQEPTTTPIGLYGITTATVNFRESPSATSDVKKLFINVKKDQNAWVIESLVNDKGETWYHINYQGTECYVHGDYFAVLSQEDSDKILYANQPPVQVAVNYIDDTTGTVFFEDTVACAVDNVTQVPLKPEEAVGYTLVGDETTMIVEVSKESVANPKVVEFHFTKNAVTGQVTFQYVGSDGAKLYDDRPESVVDGTATGSYALEAPQGYSYFGVSADTISVDTEGNAEPATVVFTYEKLSVSANVTFRYIDEATKEDLVTERNELLGEAEYSSSTFAIAVPEGMEYVGVDNESFYIDSQGAHPDTITFTYRTVQEPEPEPEPAKGSVRVDYMNADGESVASSNTFELDPGSYELSTFAIETPEGYADPTASATVVTVAENGKTEPDSLQFTFPRIDVPVVKAKVTFRYVDAGGNELEPDFPTELEPGTHQTAEFAAKPSGYTLKSVSAETVTVNDAGEADAQTVVFTYEAELTAASIEVHYTNAIGEDLPGSPQIVTRGVGDWNIEPDPSAVAQGYKLSAENPASKLVSVDGQFAATPSSISFSCYDTSVTGTLRVHYVDSETLKDLVVDPVELPPGNPSIEPDDSKVPSGYELSAASATSIPVQVSESGAVSPTDVTFYYQPVAVESYMGFAVTTQQTALRNQYNATDSSVIEMLPVNTLLYINGQRTVGTTLWDSAQVRLGDTKPSGVVLDSATRHITKTEADRIIAQYEAAHPTEVQPVQESGFYITRFNNVPQRVVNNTYASAQYYLPIDTVVYVSGQVYDAGDTVGWHISTYKGDTGYIRTTQLRKMTTAEVEAYQKNPDNTAPTQTKTAAPYDPYANSSYGYVSGSSVNFRETPNGEKIKTLGRYAFALVYGTREVNGVTWYNINQSGTIGWVHGDFFHQLNLTELTSFLNSNEYKQGLLGSSGTSTGTSGSTGGSTSGGNSSSGAAKPGKPISVEDWNVGTWQNTGVTAQTTYAPFNPYATASATVSASPSASASPTATFVIGTMIPITYDDESKETQTSTVPWGLIGAGVVLVGGAGGVYAYALNQNKKRKAAAARAAAARRANGGAAAGTAAGATKAGASSTSPYARRAVAAPPVASGSKDNQPPIGGMQNPYSRGSITPPVTPTTTPDSRVDDLYGTSAYAPGRTDATEPYGAASPYNAIPDAPVTDASAEDSSPYVSPYNAGASGLHSAGSLNPQPTQPASGSNPYVRPLGTLGGEKPATPTTPATPRRATRMQRYHAAEDERGQDE